MYFHDMMTEATEKVQAVAEIFCGSRYIFIYITYINIYNYIIGVCLYYHFNKIQIKKKKPKARRLNLCSHGVSLL